MPTVSEIRARRLAERLEGLRAAMPSLLNVPGQEVWLFGSPPEATGMRSPMWI
jgi:hypothetical protein